MHLSSHSTVDDQDDEVLNWDRETVRLKVHSSQFRKLSVTILYSIQQTNMLSMKQKTMSMTGSKETREASDLKGRVNRRDGVRLVV